MLVQQWFIKIFFRDGNYTYTRINGTKEEIRKYYKDWITISKIEFLECLGLKEQYGF